MGVVLHFEPRCLQDTFLKLRHEPLEAWCRRWMLRPYVGSCRRCEAKLEVRIPMLAGGSPGLIARACACGNRQVPFSLQGEVSARALYPASRIRWKKYRRKVIPLRRSSGTSERG